MKLSERIQIVKTPDRRLEMSRREAIYAPIVSPTPEEIEFEARRLDSLGELFSESDFNWRIEGGMSLSLHMNEFSRPYSDISVGFSRRDALLSIDYLS